MVSVTTTSILTNGDEGVVHGGEGGRGHAAEREAYGINAFNYAHMNRGQPIANGYLAEGGKMHLVVQATMDDPDRARARPSSRWRFTMPGESTDNAYRAGKMDCRRASTARSRGRPGRDWSESGATSPKCWPWWKTRAGTSISTPAASTTAGARPRSSASCWAARLPEMASEVYLQRRSAAHVQGSCGRPRSPASRSRSWRPGG